MQYIKYFLAIILNILNILPISSQISFEMIYGSSKWIEIPTDIEEDNAGNLYLSGIKQQKDLINKCGFLIKFNPEGEVIQEYSICNPDSSYEFGHIIRINDSIFVFGDKGSIYRDNQNLVYSLQFDFDLNPVKSSEYFTFPDLLDVATQSVLFSNNYFIILLNAVPINEPFYPDIGFFKLNKNLDSISCIIDRREYNQLAFDFTLNSEGNIYKVFVMGNYPNSYPSYSELVQFDTTFSLINVDSIPYKLHNQFSTKRFNNSTYFVAGNKIVTNPSHVVIGIIKMSETDSLMLYNQFGKSGDTNNYAGVLYSIDFTDKNSLFLGGTSNILPFEYPWQTEDSWIMLNNLDSNLNLRWQKFYGGDAFYHLRGLKVTQDGGCLMYATRYDENTQDEEFDVYILKVDTAGLLTSTGDGPHIPVQQLAILPNPATGLVSIRYPDIFGYDEKEILIYNALGNIVKRAQATQNPSETRIEIHDLPAGLYFAVLQVEGIRIATGKILKR